LVVKKKKSKPEGSRSPGKDPESPPRPKLSLGKKVIFSVIAASLGLILLELGLALVGVTPTLYEDDPYVGFSSYLPLFVEKRLPDGTVQYATAQNKLRLFNRQSFPKAKAPGTFRIFAVGGSTTHGRPYDDATSFAGWLREFLRAADPERTWEVINAGGVSYASYRVALLMEELVRYEPDLFIIYSGHNEFLEERTYGDVKEMPVPVRRLGTIAARSRAATLVKNGIEALTSGKPDQLPGQTLLHSEVVTLLDDSVGPSAYERDESLQRQVIEHYRYNLARMIDIARSAGAEVLLIAPSSNLHGATPFKSEHRTGMSEDELSRWRERYRYSQKILNRQDPAGALRLLDEAAGIDDRYAYLHFYRGHALERLGRHEEARAAFVRARDEDICPLRALSPMVDIVKEIAEDREVPLVDFVASQNARSPNGIPGETVFLDHVHPTIDSHRLLALEIMDVMADAGIAVPDLDRPTAERVRKEVTGQIDPVSHARALMNLSKVLGWAGKSREAYRLAAQAAQMTPGDAAVQYQAGLMAQLTGETDVAISHYRQAIELEPTVSLAHGNLGVALEQSGDFEGAIHHFRLALQYGVNPTDNARNQRNLERVEQSLRGP
jgi:tetratricopeptide (TPR) repeat protein